VPVRRCLSVRPTFQLICKVAKLFGLLANFCPWQMPLAVDVNKTKVSVVRPGCFVTKTSTKAKTETETETKTMTKTETTTKTKTVCNGQVGI